MSAAPRRRATGANPRRRPAPPARLRRSPGAPALAILALAACAGGSGDAGASEEAGAAMQPDSVRFAIEVAETTHEPVWVYLNTESRPVGWVTVLRDGRPEYFEERCEIPDCGAEPAVCGAAIPLIRRVAEADGAGAIAYVWDGTTSELDETEDGCERRVAAPAGAYTARFCYGAAAEPRVGGVSDPAEGAPGAIAELTCVERAFTLGTDDEVVLDLP